MAVFQSGSSFAFQFSRNPVLDTSNISLVFARRVLVVDDNVDSAEMLQTLFEISGHTVRIAHDGPTTLSVAASFLPDVILLDIGLPGMDGYDVVQQLREMPALAGITIVATTGYGGEEDRARCLAAGFDDHLTKPIDHTQLERLLAATT